MPIHAKIIQAASTYIRRVPKVAALVVSAYLVTGCTTNAVTGKRQLSMPISQQVSLGNQQYKPSLQQQGGRYVIAPELNLYVANVGKKLAAHAPVKLPYEFTVLNNDVPNAWALPGGKIAINTGLLVLLDDEAQLAAVLGHEIIHAAAEHGANQMRKAQLLGLGGLVVGIAARDSEYGQYIGMGTALASGMYQAKYGRDQELESDRYGMDLMQAVGYDPQGAVELQETFVKLSGSAKGSWLDNMFASHPPSAERVAKNRERAQSMNGNVRNRAQYQKAISQLKKDQTANNAHRAAQKALSEKNYTEALAQVDSAIRKQPKAAQFYITKGNIFESQKNMSAALTAYQKAASTNPDFFLGNLHAGLSAKKLAKNLVAEQALSKSMRQLPTPIAAYYLSEFALKKGNKSEAIKLLQFAAQDQGEVGEAAKQQLSKLQPAA